ncbi:MAG TPA: hypothetical protein VEC12_06015 [Bacteroidia bacterium]|nr:hypothetical protein [Bacteroidia bacterium]
MSSEIAITDYASFKIARKQLEEELKVHEVEFDKGVEKIAHKVKIVGLAMGIAKQTFTVTSLLRGGVSKLIINKLIGLVIDKVFKTKDSAQGPAGWSAKAFDNVKNVAVEYKNKIAGMVNNLFSKKKSRAV